MQVQLKPALESDRQAIQTLIAQSARALGQRCYSREQIEAALISAFGVDSQLIVDGTYFLAFDNGQLAGCGGWSYRATKFGSDREKNRNADPVDPASGAAKIRAFFVHPDFARRGVGKLILRRCEAEAWRHGFRRLELVATLPGVEFYRIHGYLPADPFEHRLENGLTIRFVPMAKRLKAPPSALQRHEPTAE